MTERPSDPLKAALSRAGLRLTRPRRAVWEALAGGGDHLTPGEILRRVRRVQPSIGLSTVYRTLRLLADLGLVRPLFLGEAGQRFVRVEGGHHEHLVCDACGRVVEIDDCPLEGVEAAMAARTRFQIWGHFVEFYGLCGRCAGDSI